MNAQENTVMIQIERDIAEIKAALLGNALSGDKGLVGRVDTMTVRQDMQDKLLKNLEEDKIKNGVYMKIIISLASMLAVGFISLLFSYFNK